MFASHNRHENFVEKATGVSVFKFITDDGKNTLECSVPVSGCFQLWLQLIHVKHLMVPQLMSKH